MKIISIIIYLICSVGGLVLIKSEANSVNVALQSGVFNLSMGIKSILGFIAYIASFLIYTFSTVLLSSLFSSPFDSVLFSTFSF